MLIHRSVYVGTAEALASLSGEQRRAIQFMEGCVQSWPFQTITPYYYLGARPRAAASGPCPPAFAGERMDILVPPVSIRSGNRTKNTHLLNVFEEILACYSFYR